MTANDNLPFWSVMMPVFRPNADYLKRALDSVLEQDPGSADMQIAVIDDASPDVDSEQIVRAVTNGRVYFVRNGQNCGLAGSWNRCVELARGRWIHILHQDDYVLPGFYGRIESAIVQHSNAGLIASRCHILDSDGVISGVTPRVPKLENGGRSVSDFYYANPIQCPGVVVQRDCYARYGGFRTDLSYTLDLEMWTRVISRCGGVVLPDVLAAYRLSRENETSKLLRSAEAFEDFARLSTHFTKQYPDFDPQRARQEICKRAMIQAGLSQEQGDVQGAEASLAYWRRNAPFRQKCRHILGSIARRMLG